MTIDRNILLARIDSIATAEKVTKKELGLLSRELLTYIVLDDSNDIDMVNRLIGVLSPVNKRVAVLFFDHFLPFKAEFDGEGKRKVFVRFGGKEKGERKLSRYADNVTSFLEDEYNNIWTWQASHVDVDKVPDYNKSIQNAVKKALSDSENGLSQTEVLNAVFAGGIEIDAVIAVLNSMTVDSEAA